MRFHLRSTLLALLASASLAIPAVALGYGDGTPDLQPPAEEPPCDVAELRGAAYGLCIAYCEANDCEIQADKSACEILQRNYAKITGGTLFPCDPGWGIE